MKISAYRVVVGVGLTLGLILGGLVAVTMLRSGYAVAQGEPAVSAPATERAILLSDGRTVTCLVRTALYATAMSCDWSNAR